MEQQKRKHASDFYSTYARGTALYVRWAAERGISYQETIVLYSLHAENGIQSVTVTVCRNRRSMPSSGV